MLSLYDSLNPPVERNNTPNTTQQANIHHWTGQARAFEFMLVQVLVFHSISIQKSSVCIWFSNRAFRNFISNFEPSLKKETRNKICWHFYNWTTWLTLQKQWIVNKHWICFRHCHAVFPQCHKVIQQWHPTKSSSTTNNSLVRSVSLSKRAHYFGSEIFP